MTWSQDPRIQKLLETATLEGLFKNYFQRVYGADEIMKMEKALKFALEKYEKKDRLQLLEDDEPLVNECLHRICGQSGQNHSSETLLILTKLLIRVGDHRLAFELIWCSASIAIQEFISDRQLKVSLHSPNSKDLFAGALSDDLRRRFSVFGVCHSLFYDNRYGDREVNLAFKDATEFLQILRDFQITDEKKKELEKTNFND